MGLAKLRALCAEAESRAPQPELYNQACMRVDMPMRDLSLCALNRISIYTNNEIGGVFGVGYMAVTESIKRAERYLEKNKRIAKQVSNIIDN